MKENLVTSTKKKLRQFWDCHRLPFPGVNENLKIPVDLFSSDGSVVTTTRKIDMSEKVAGKPKRRSEGPPNFSSNVVVVAMDDDLDSIVNCIEKINERTNYENYVLSVVYNGFEKCICDAIDKYHKDGVVDWYWFSEGIQHNHILQGISENNESDWVVLVDPNVIVTENWLCKMMECARKNDVEMLEPMSNNVAPIFPGSNYIEMNDAAENTCRKLEYSSDEIDYSCLAVWYDTLEQYKDNDFSLIGDVYRVGDCYVYNGNIGNCSNPEFDNVKDFILGCKEYKSKRANVLFVLREAPICGMVLATIHLCNKLIELGWNASFACTRLEKNHRKHMPMNFEPYVFQDRTTLVQTLKDHFHDGILIAPTWVTAEDVKEISDNKKRVRSVYFIQDDERRFRHLSGEFYTQPETIERTFDMIENKVVNSDWVLDEIKALGHDADKIGIGVDTLMFRPRQDNRGKIRIMAHCRASTPRRGWPFICEVINRASRYVDFEFVTYDEIPEDLNVKHHISLGRVSPIELSRQMSISDIFFEGSMIQGWGMQALEAMSCGCALLCTDNRGIHNFGVSGYDCVIIPYSDVERAVAIICTLVEDQKQRKIFGQNARKTALNFDWNYIAQVWDEYLIDL